MTKPFWTPEKKKDYLMLKEKREAERKYYRDYMNAARQSGKYKYYRDENNKVVYKKDENDEKRSRK